MRRYQPILLGVNVDHVATLRQARGTTRYPDPVQAALLAEQAGADGITVHLREDRRHIQQRDVELIQERCQTRLNFEMAATDAMLEFALNLQPHFCCLVPEKREELTTEGGLDVVKHFTLIKVAVDTLMAKGIEVSLFIDPNLDQIAAARETGADWIEIHTGRYAEAKAQDVQTELVLIQESATYADKIGLKVNGGHGLHYHNVQAIAAIPEMVELNIGHAIIAESIFVGLHDAVSNMKRLMREARLG
jgi:pyridoxine 5-phosphate synthase